MLGNGTKSVLLFCVTMLSGTELCGAATQKQDLKRPLFHERGDSHTCRRCRVKGGANQERFCALHRLGGQLANVPTYRKRRKLVEEAAQSIPCWLPEVSRVMFMCKKEQINPLYDAIRADDGFMVESYLAGVCPGEVCDRNALFEAWTCKMVQTLLNHGFLLSVMTPEKETVLHRAIVTQKPVELIKYYTRNVSDSNALTMTGYTALALLATRVADYAYRVIRQSNQKKKLQSILPGKYLRLQSIVKALIDGGASVNIAVGGGSPAPVGLPTDDYWGKIPQQIVKGLVQSSSTSVRTVDCCKAFLNAYDDACERRSTAIAYGIGGPTVLGKMIMSYE